MADGEAARDDVGREEEGVVHAQRVEHHRLGHGLIRLAGHDLDDPPGQAEAGVVVGPQRAGRHDLWQVGHLGHVAGQRVVAAARLAEEVAQPAAHVGQQVAGGDRSLGRLVLQAQFGQILFHRRVEADQPLFDEAHDDGAGDRLGGGADLEQGVGRDRQGVLDAGDAKTGQLLAAVMEQPDGHAGHAQPPHLRDNEVAQLLEVGVVGFVVGGYGEHRRSFCIGL